MNHVSVIIPTIYKKPKILYKLTELLSSDECVNEILIISNSDYKMTFPNTSKLKIYTPENNLYVNGSWNKGVEICKENNFLIINDDIMVCEDFCSMVVNSDIFNNKDTGLIGLDPQSIIRLAPETEELQIPPKTKPIYLQVADFLDMKDWGSAFFGKKENYYRIPDDLKIFFGDNYLVHKNMLNNKNNYSLGGTKVYHLHQSSSGCKEFEEIIQQDIKNQENYFFV